MIVTEHYITRKDGVELQRTYSSLGMKIMQNETEVLYNEAIDPVDSGRTYTETELPVDTTEATADELLNIIVGNENIERE